MGNHDDREALRRQFGLEPASGAPLHYVADLGAARLIVLDTTIPGQDGGELDPTAWPGSNANSPLRPREPTVLAMHHPPLLTGSPAGIDRADRALTSGARGHARRHPQVRQILGAHLHRPLFTQFGGRPLVVAPSTYVQFPLRLQPRARSG